MTFTPKNCYIILHTKCVWLFVTFSDVLKSDYCMEYIGVTLVIKGLLGIEAIDVSVVSVTRQMETLSYFLRNLLTVIVERYTMWLSKTAQG